MAVYNNHKWGKKLYQEWKKARKLGIKNAVFIVIFRILQMTKEI